MTNSNGRRPLVKICGITNLEDAVLASNLGADMLGLIFVESSPRCIKSDAARKIRNEIPKHVQLVGVFKDADAQTIDSAVRDYKLDFVQCHGSETPEFCAALPFPLIKALSISHDVNHAETLLREQIEGYVSARGGSTASGAFVFLIDRPKDQAARTDWLDKTIQFLKDSPQNVPYFFAGGLNSGNVGRVVREINPYGVDVASGVEGLPGRKDPAALKQFFEAVFLKQYS